MNREQAIEEARGLVAEGWTVLACDIPETKMMGLYVFRFRHRDTLQVLTGDFEPEDAVEESKMLEWPVYGKPMTEIDDKTVEVDDLINFVGDNHENLASCDDPKKLQLGFVRYDPENGRAIVRRVCLAQVKNASKEIRERFMPLREEFQRRIREDHEALMQEVHA